jgi:hypothetical protein
MLVVPLSEKQKPQKLSQRTKKSGKVGAIRIYTATFKKLKFKYDNNKSSKKI